MRSPGFLGLIYDRYWPCNICGDHTVRFDRLFAAITLYVLTDNGSNEAIFSLGI